MAKRPPNFGGMGNIMKQAEKMQKQMLKMQAELEEKDYEATSGGGMVTAKVNGKSELVSLKIDPEVVDPEDVEMLEDLIISAIKEATRKCKEFSEKEMGKITGGLNIPGLF